MRFEGFIKSWNDERGFGFIEPNGGGGQAQDIFVHVKALGPRTGRPQLNQRVTFEVELGPQGKKRAKNVEIVGAVSTRQRERRDNPAQWGTASFFAIPVFLAIYLMTSVVWRVSHWWAGAYLGVSAICFVAYAIDKSAAAADRRRIDEGTLILLGLACGWPGAIVAQQVLRHKSSKLPFRTKFWGSVVINVVAFVAFNSPLIELLRS